MFQAGAAPITVSQLFIALIVVVVGMLLAKRLARLVGLRRSRVVFDRPTGELDDADFHALYELTQEEMLADGS